MLPRNPYYVIAGKREIRHLDAWRCQKFVQFFSLRPVVPLGQFPPHAVEAEFGLTVSHR